jgi:rRNA-processing protein EBP2
MAKVKDRLIFENKKMEAVAQRKSNKEQKLRVRETHDNKLAEKAKRKREHERAVEDWAKSSHSGAGSADDLKRGDGPNKKRLAADRKYGRGGKKGRFKQNDRKSMDDMSSFNPRGNFAGGGTKRTRSSSSGKGGSNRPGKRARDAGRSRRST